MKNLLSEDMMVMDLSVNTRNVIPARKKKMTRDLFLPNAGWSTIKKETIRDGASPRTVNI